MFCCTSSSQIWKHRWCIRTSQKPLELFKTIQRTEEAEVPRRERARKLAHNWRQLGRERSGRVRAHVLCVRGLFLRVLPNPAARRWSHARHKIRQQRSAYLVWCFYFSLVSFLCPVVYQNHIL